MSEATSLPGSWSRLVLLVLMSSGVFSIAGQPPASTKQLVAHRGASAYSPEHTLEAYRLALEQGADFVEQDLAVTKDGVLVCIHDMSLERTTDVETVFPDRYVEERVGFRRERRWLVSDFTLAEIRQLDAGSWFHRTFAGARVPTFQEGIDLVRGKAGLYPELKDPAFYRARGVKPEALLRDVLKQNRLPDDPKTPVIDADGRGRRGPASRAPSAQGCRRDRNLEPAGDSDRLGSRDRSARLQRDCLAGPPDSGVLRPLESQR